MRELDDGKTGGNHAEQGRSLRRSVRKVPRGLQVRCPHGAIYCEQRRDIVGLRRLMHCMFSELGKRIVTGGPIYWVSYNTSGSCADLKR